MYTTWKVGDTVEIGVKIEDFCGTVGNPPNWIYLNSYDMQLYPTTLNIICNRPNCAFSCLDTRNRQVIFYSCKDYVSLINDVYCANRSVGKFYRELGRISSDSNGISSLNHVVTNQDLADYNDAISSGGHYNIVACINDSQATNSHAINFGNITVAANLCLNVTCANKCFGNDLYTQVCDPNTGNCVKGTLIQANSPICTATDRIDYDLSALPTSFLDLIASNILQISNILGPYLPAASNIQYLGSDYTGGKFRIFVRYTPPAGMAKMLDYDISNIEQLQLIQTLTAYAQLLAGVLIFILAGIVGSRLGWQLGAVTAVIGMVVVAWGITNLPTGASGNYTQGQPTPDQKLKTVKDYVDTYLKPACTDLYPTCAATPPTCNTGTMRAYNGCIGGNSVAECRQAAAVAGDSQTTCDSTFNEVSAIDTCLANGTCTVQNAKDRLNTVVENTTTYVNGTIDKVTCPSGKVYDATSQTCIEQCAIPGPFGSCLLTQATLRTIALIGGLTIGGYLVLKYITRPKPQRLVVQTQPTSTPIA